MHFTIARVRNLLLLLRMSQQQGKKRVAKGLLSGVHSGHGRMPVKEGLLKGE
jgi:hypothetical protein